MKLIDKDVIITELDKRKNLCEKILLDLRTKENIDYYQGKAEAYKEVLDLLNTHEVKYLQEELKKCMYTNEHYTDEDRKVLCEDCEEDCEYAKKVEPSIVIVLNSQRHRQVWHKGCFSKKECKEKCSLYGSCQRCSIDLCMIFFHDPHCHFEEEPVSEELETEIEKYLNALYRNWTKKDREKDADVEEMCRQTACHFAQWQKEQEYTCYEEAFEDGAKWKKEEMMKGAIDAVVHIDAGGYPYIPQMELYDYDKDIPLAKEGDKYKVVLIKEE